MNRLLILPAVSMLLLAGAWPVLADPVWRVTHQTSEVRVETSGTTLTLVVADKEKHTTAMDAFGRHDAKTLLTQVRRAFESARKSKSGDNTLVSTVDRTDLRVVNDQAFPICTLQISQADGSFVTGVLLPSDEAPFEATLQKFLKS